MSKFSLILILILPVFTCYSQKKSELFERIIQLEKEIDKLRTASIQQQNQISDLIKTLEKNGRESTDLTNTIIDLKVAYETLLKENAQLKNNIQPLKIGNEEKAKTQTNLSPVINNFNANSTPNTNSYKPRNTPTRRYIRGPRGGCYYINGNGNKTYVDRSLCR